LGPISTSQLAEMIKQATLTFEQQAKGFVIIEGHFRVSRKTESVQFEEQFSPYPHHIVFDFTLPAKSDSSEFRDGYKFRVFGDVTKELDSQGKIEIHALAIF